MVKKSPAAKAAAKKLRRQQKVQKKKSPKQKSNQKNIPVQMIGRMVKSGNRTTNRRLQVIEEDEFIADINGSVGFTNTTFQVNPGNAVTFPWGSRPSGNYSEYQYEYLEFYYKPEVSGFATQGQTGKVILSFDYDATATAPTTKQQVEAIDPHADEMPCDPITLRVDCQQIHKGDSKYVLPGSQPANTDLKTYNAGVLNVSTIGQANTTLVGELHVRYRVRLEKPILDPATVAGGIVHFSGTVPTTADNFATMAQQSGGSPSLTAITAASNVITFPAGIPGNYLIVFQILVGTSATAWSAANWTPGAGAANVNLLTNTTRDSTAELFSAAATAGTALMAMVTYSVPVTGGTVTVTPSTIVGGAGSDLWISSLPVTVLTVDEQEQLEIDNLKQSNRTLELRLNRLESLLSGRSSPIHEECKDDDMEKSVHIDRAALASLLRGATKQ